MQQSHSDCIISAGMCLARRGARCRPTGADGLDKCPVYRRQCQGQAEPALTVLMLDILIPRRQLTDFRACISVLTLFFSLR